MRRDVPDNVFGPARSGLFGRCSTWLCLALFAACEDDGTGPGLPPPSPPIMFVSNRDSPDATSPEWRLFETDANGQEIRQISMVLVGAVSAAWSPDATRIAFPGPAFWSTESATGVDPFRQDVYLLAIGTPEPVRLRVRLGPISRVSWAPDGVRLLLATAPRFFPRTGSPNIQQLFVLDTGSGELVQLTREERWEFLEPDWSPDGSQIAFVSDRDGSYEIYTMELASMKVRRLTSDTIPDRWPTWSPDGRRIAFSKRVSPGCSAIFLMQVDGGRPAQLTKGVGCDGGPTWSPDGRQIAYHSNEEGNFDIHVIDSGGGNPRRLTRGRASDFNPTWRPRP